jgi:hypothetical protein
MRSGDAFTLKTAQAPSEPATFSPAIPATGPRPRRSARVK